jgi:hypothetical protein
VERSKNNPFRRFPIRDCRSSDRLLITCTACGRATSVGYVQLQGIAAFYRYLGDIEPYLRCTGCHTKGQARLELKR